MVARAQAVYRVVGRGYIRAMSDTLEGSSPAPSLNVGLGLVAAAVSHAGWWLEWQLRVRSGEGTRNVDGPHETEIAGDDSSAVA
jgi:hypothetical protein